MSYIRGYISDNTRFHLIGELLVSQITSFNTSASTSISPTKSLFFGLCDDGTQLIWKSNKDTLINTCATFVYKTTNLNTKLKLVKSNNHIPLVKSTNNLLIYDSTKSNSTDINFTTSYNVNKSLLYGGINYNIKYIDGNNNIYMKFAKPTTQIDLPSTTNSNLTQQGWFYNDSNDEVSIDITTLKFNIYIIPHIQHSHKPDNYMKHSSDHLNSMQYFTQFIYKSLPSRYKPLKPNAFADKDMSVIFTNMHDKQIGFIYDYCLEGIGCGKCMGICPRGEVCNVHENTGNDKTDELTCDHAKGKSESKSLTLYMIFIIIISVLFIIGVGGYYIYKNFNKTKNKDKDFNNKI